MPDRAWCLLAAALLSAGCASAPDKPATGIAPHGAAAEPAEASAAAAPSSASSAPAKIAPIPTVDVNRQPPAENTGLVCREMLKPLSNVIITKCMTPAAWKNYRQAEARQAQELLRFMQSGR